MRFQPGNASAKTYKLYLPNDSELKTSVTVITEPAVRSHIFNIKK